jgi:3-oxoacyl-[acyl-carrier-protein] synthase III
MLLAHHGGDRGFQRFELRTFGEDAALFEAYVRWDPDAGLLHRGRNVLEVHEAPGFAARCVEHAIDVAREILDDAGLDGDDVDVLVASQYPRHFAREVARGLRIPAYRVPDVRDELAAAHTAGAIASLEAAIASGRVDHARQVLFVTAGAGITSGVALYVQAPPS